MIRIKANQTNKKHEINMKLYTMKYLTMMVKKKREYFVNLLHTQNHWVIYSLFSTQYITKLGSIENYIWL